MNHTCEHLIHKAGRGEDSVLEPCGQEAAWEIKFPNKPVAYACDECSDDLAERVYGSRYYWHGNLKPLPTITGQVARLTYFFLHELGEQLLPAGDADPANNLQALLDLAEDTEKAFRLNCLRRIVSEVWNVMDAVEAEKEEAKTCL